MTNETTIRPASKADIAYAAAMEKLCFTVPWSVEDFTDLYEESEQPENPITRTLFYVCTDADDGLAGYICVRRVLDEGEILNVATSPHARRQGIARRLMTAVTEELTRSGTKEIFLEVRESNRPAIALYEAMDFKPIGRRKEYYRVPTEDAIVMKRTI